MTKKNYIEYANLSWPQVVSALKEHILVLPTGAIEQHGPHLPLSVDIDIATEMAKSVATRIGGVVAPGISYGGRSFPHSGGGPAFPGTIHVQGGTLLQLYSEIIHGYSKAGARKILVINGHFENEGFLFEAIELCRESQTLSTTQVVALSWWSVVKDAVIDRFFGNMFPGWHAEHAGLCETALMLHLKPSLVGKTRPDNPSPPRAGIYDSREDGSGVALDGVLAQSSNATKTIGKQLFEHVSNEICKVAVEKFH